MYYSVFLLQLAFFPQNLLPSMKPSTRFLSGIQPTGIPHLGNFLGAIKPWSLNRNSFLFLADLHSITVYQEPLKLQTNIIEMAASLLACGIDFEENCIFRQSKIQQHAELGWILMCNTPYSWLTRMHQFKTKSSESTSLGLLSYPVLQAADILLYDATHVPVGDDQSQHINLTADLARSFNHTYKKPVFTVPKGQYPLKSGRIMSLKNPLQKMSKSDPAEMSRININDSDDDISKKIKKAVMDSTVGITLDKERPGVENLLNILMSIQDFDVTRKEKWSELPPEELVQVVLERFGRIQESCLGCDYRTLGTNTAKLQQLHERAPVFRVVFDRWRRKGKGSGLEKGFCSL